MYYVRLFPSSKSGGIMSLLGFLVLIFVASICGSIGSHLAGYSTKGCFTNILLGLIGALIGSWLSQELGVRDYIYFAGIPVLWAIIGSALFVALIGLISGRSLNGKKGS
jgi:uncharacterized membrane protein YeaQ/YmgE (transglycosylase-associated protein family)